MSTRITSEIHDGEPGHSRPIRSQSSWRWNYFPAERSANRVRRQGPNAFVAARMGYRAAL
jgi:hypothetical protein